MKCVNYTDIIAWDTLNLASGNILKFWASVL